MIRESSGRGCGSTMALTRSSGWSGIARTSASCRCCPRRRIRGPSPIAAPRQTHPIFVVARLAPDATVDTAQQETAAIAADLERTYPVNAARGANVEPVADVVFGPVRTPLYVLFGAVGLVLLVACANVAGLVLARGTGRTREVAVRAALGASEWRIVRLFLAEGVLLSLGATLLGCGLAYLGVRALLGLAPADIPRLSDVGLDTSVLGATALLSIAVAFVVGLIPVLQARRFDLNGVLKTEGTRASEGRGRRHTREALIVAELALSVMLVSEAGLVIRSFSNLLRVDPGFHAGGILKAEYNLPATRYPSDFRVWPDFKEQHAFIRALLSRVATLPGVQSAAIAGNHPLDPGFTNSFSVVGREAEARTWPEISIRLVTPGYFRTMGVGLARGRLLEDGDTTRGAPVVVVNEAAAARFFPDRDAIGARLRFWGTSRTIVGIVANEKFQGLTKGAPIAVYTPMTQTPSAIGAGVLLVRTDADPEALASPVRRVIREIDPELAVFGVEPFVRTVSRSIGQQRFTMIVLAVFAAVALLLAAIGVHAMFSYAVLRRRREIGIRLALGAAPSAVWRLVVLQGLTLAVIGTVLGVAGALAVSRLVATLLFGVTARDPFTFAAVAALLLIVAGAATLGPARRAARVDPLVVLRSE
ncbi:MAG: ABC transporter permease [Acidobacteria bacterium]|nr:MAG: ABC transporter permease [Acidobacteriota bacterium]